MNDERYAFYEDVRNRSRSTGKRAKRWGRGVIMPSDLTKTKRKGKGYNVETRKSIGMYWNEFQKKNKNEQADLLRTWAKMYTPSEIAEGLGCKTTSLIPLIKYFQITYKTKEREELKTAEPKLNITYEQFKELSDEERLSKYERLLKTFSKDELTKQWGLNRTTIDNMMYSTRNRVSIKRVRKNRTDKPKAKGVVPQMKIPQVEEKPVKEVPAQEQQTTSIEDVSHMFTRIFGRIKELEAENARLKQIETSYNTIVSVLGNAMKGAVL